MGEIGAQEFLVMGVEIDDGEPPAGGKRARGFAQAPAPDRRGSAAPGG